MNEVPEDYVCEHGMPKPWVTCFDCMMLPPDEQPTPPKPKPAPKPAPKATPARRSSQASGSPRRASANREKAPSTRLPRAVTDATPPLFGEYDLCYEVPDEHVDYHIRGTESGWLAISRFPTHLRPGGWVYLQVDRDVVAKARVKGIGFRERRWSQEPASTAADMGAGPTLELDGNTWERMLVDLGPDGDRVVKGYRYLAAGEDGELAVVDPAGSGE